MTVGDLVRHRAARRAVVVVLVLAAFGAGAAVGGRGGAASLAVQPSAPPAAGGVTIPPTSAPVPSRTRVGPADASVDGATALDDTGGAAPAAPRAAPKAPVPTFSCPAAGRAVSTAQALEEALRSAGPGDVIRLADGVYEGEFVATARGTAAAPIHLCGGRGAVLDAGSVTGGYILHFDGAEHWRVDGFTLRNGQKGVMVDSGRRIGLQDLLVEQIGDEAVHLRRGSTENVVRGLTIRGTGQRRDKFGEGVYVGTAESNWCDISGCEPDRSDGNFVLDNRIGPTTSEGVDIKEGTSGGVVAGNILDGSGLVAADSWVDVKGNGWLVLGNHGSRSPQDGFQTHVVEDGWGQGNVFRDNVADLAGGSGVGFYLHRDVPNTVACDNRATGAAGGLSNRPCG
ncbi:MAG: hypothetical protein ACKVZ6_22450 [Kineosporiaceae bacterium]|jgi:hypothetical protein